MGPGFYGLLRRRFMEILEEKGVMDEHLEVVSAWTLNAEDAIGRPERNDYPLLKGKEVMIEANFRGAKGQAFTDTPGGFDGILRDVTEFPLTNNFQKALFIASLNAVMRYFGLIDGTIHCKDKEPGLCAKRFVEVIRERFGAPKIAFIGFQPAMIEELSRAFQIRVLDLDKENIGKEKFNLIIEGPERQDGVLSWCDIILATGSSCVNSTITDFIKTKPVIFYGVSVAGAAKILELNRYCPYSH